MKVNACDTITTDWVVVPEPVMLAAVVGAPWFVSPFGITPSAAEALG